VRRTPADKGLYPDGMTAGEAAADTARTTEYRTASVWRSKDWTIWMAMRTRQFWLLFTIWLVAMGIVEQIAISHHVYFYLDAGYAPLAAATFFGVFGVCFAAGNLLGAISDRIGRERFFIPVCLMCAGFVSLYFLMRDASTPWLPPIIAAGFGLTFGSLCCVLNATLADLFQGKHYGRIAGSMIVGFAVGGTISPWMAGHLHDLTGSYTITYAVLVAALIATALLMRLVSPGRLSPVANTK
jgi:MFS family permease